VGLGKVKNGDCKDEIIAEVHRKSNAVASILFLGAIISLVSFGLSFMVYYMRPGGDLSKFRSLRSSSGNMG
jgi:hypothetical protein